MTATITATHPLHAALRNASTSEILWALGEILEPSYNGPFANSYGGDDDATTDTFMDALVPVIEAYSKAYRGLANIITSEARAEMARERMDERAYEASI